jgi:tRNA-splicing ligase RtcB
MANYTVYTAPNQGLVKAWVQGVPVEQSAVDQLTNIAQLPFIHKWVAAMPDVHTGIGATVGSVIPTRRAIIPAAVGVDLGCGMVAAQTTLRAADLPDDLAGIRTAIEAAVPHGRTNHGGRGDVGSWDEPPDDAQAAWATLRPDYVRIVAKYPKLNRGSDLTHLGTLGTGNHFVEVCLDEADQVWLMLHSGSRGVGNRIGSFFIELARREMERWFIHLPDKDLAYFPEGTEHFDDYWHAVQWAQQYARANRELMLRHILAALALRPDLPPFELGALVVHCHHNYVAREHHYGENVFVTRKGAVRAREGDLGIIPGSMGARSYIVRGKGQPESFTSCSHGAGRAMSRAEARRRFTLADHAQATAGVECRKDEDVLDETPAAYKAIDRVSNGSPG